MNRCHPISSHHVPYCTPTHIKAVHVHEGDWDCHDTVKFWIYTCEGKLDVFKERVEYDDAKKTVKLNGPEGGCDEVVQMCNVIYEFVAKEDYNGKGKPQGVAKLTIEYEKLKPDVIIITQTDQPIAQLYHGPSWAQQTPPPHPNKSPSPLHSFLSPTKLSPSLSPPTGGRRREVLRPPPPGICHDTSPPPLLLLRTSTPTAASSPTVQPAAVLPASAAVVQTPVGEGGGAALQAALLVAGHIPGRGVAEAEEEQQEPSEQERDGRGRRRAQGLHRTGIRIRFPRGRSSALQHPAGSGAVLRRQQALQRLRLQIVHGDAVFAHGVIRLRPGLAFSRRQPGPRHLRPRGESSDGEDAAAAVGAGGSLFGTAILRLQQLTAVESMKAVIGSIENASNLFDKMRERRGRKIKKGGEGILSAHQLFVALAFGRRT